jgi:SAM-dependent methyltransferase
MKPQFNRQIAAAYDRHSEKYVPLLEPMMAPMARQIAAMAGLADGQRALDLATGAGLIARVLARLTDAVIGVDISPGVLRIAYRQSRGETAYVCGDACRLPFESSSFNLVTCGVSLSHFSDVPAALEEVRRLLHPGGRLVASAWGAGGESPAKEAAVEVRRKFLPDKELTFGGEFSEDLWADAERGCETLRQAGFVDVKVDTSRLDGVYRDHMQAIETALAWPITRYRVAQMSLEDQSRLRQETAAAIRRVKDLSWWSEVHYYQAARPGG